ncbi:hypothetical protein RchiOBHm_Chr6g0289261 [Rosa chinensis]|uniref:Uncharacterized protein n=1 Tax=Rosa chinensis TaxID=74649 RepID=A0A2P6PVK0_ROSCH|nr:hypothetical protein RchiOBHm_Chr6g0289261 [Rosa chinensis]
MLSFTHLCPQPLSLDCSSLFLSLPLRTLCSSLPRLFLSLPLRTLPRRKMQTSPRSNPNII